jgi:hypothetical protein
MGSIAVYDFVDEWLGAIGHLREESFEVTLDQGSADNVSRWISHFSTFCEFILDFSTESRL